MVVVLNKITTGKAPATSDILLELNAVVEKYVNMYVHVCYKYVTFMLWLGCSK